MLAFLSHLVIIIGVLRGKLENRQMPIVQKYREKTSNQ
jgi:hypothetical protein